MRLSKFLYLGEYAEACFSLSMGWPRIALHRGSAQYINKKQFFLLFLSLSFSNVVHKQLCECTVPVQKSKRQEIRIILYLFLVL